MLDTHKSETPSNFLIRLALLAMICTSCAIAADPERDNVTARSSEQLQFTYLTKLPEGQFLFLSVDDKPNCLNAWCCIESESPAPPFHFRDSKLVLNEFALEPNQVVILSGAGDWLQVRAQVDPIALYAYHNHQSAGLKLLRLFPFETPDGGATILGVNSLGDIQVRAADGYAVVPVGSTTLIKQEEKGNEYCTVFHRYYLFNHGLISDKDTVFYVPMPR